MCALNKFFILLIVTTPALCFGITTDVYKCETKKGVEFSQYPCTNNPEFFQLNVEIPVSKKQPSVVYVQSTDLTIDSYIKVTAIKKKITEHLNKIDTYKTKMQKQVNVFNKRLDSQHNSLTGTKRTIAIADQMIATIAHFDVLIKNEQTSINFLDRGLERLRSTKKRTSENNIINDNIGNFIKKQKIEREIQQATNKIITLTDGLKKDTEELEQKTSNKVGYKQGGESSRVLSKKMSALNTQYNLLIAIEHSKLTRLHEKKSFISMMLRVAACFFI